MTRQMTSDDTGRMLELLDRLYIAAEGDEPFGELIKASDLYFFSQAQSHELLADTQASLDAFEAFRKHIDRIERTVADKDATAEISTQLDTQLASIQIEVGADDITGNAAAEALFGMSLPCKFEDLPLAPQSATRVRGIIRDASAGKFQGVSVIPLAFSHRDDVLIAKCNKFDTFSETQAYIPVVQMTVSYVKWTHALLGFASDQYGLTDAEIEVLAVLLDGITQAQVAERLGKSRETVKAQAKSILRKFGATQMADVHKAALAYAFMGRGSRVPEMSTPKMATVALSGSRMMSVGNLRSVEVWEYGAPDGLPVVFWHGLIFGPFFSPDMIAAFMREGLRVICVSRPGFGRSSPPVRWPDYDATVTADVVCVLDQLGIDRMSFWVHQAGISFACRAAAALKGRVKHAAMNGAGVPIKPYMLPKMNRHSRVAAATVLHAPKLLELLLRIGFKTWRISGSTSYFRQFFGKDGVEQAALGVPELENLFELGFLHVTAQSPDAMIWDGKSAMLDWSHEFVHFDFPQVWMHGLADQILSDEFVQDFLTEYDQPDLMTYEGYGSDLLYRGFDQIFPPTAAFFRDDNPVG